VPGAIPSLLLLTAAATAAFHTLIPDHWLPFVLVGRARGWSARTVAAVSGLSALVHTLLSVALGLAALLLGQTVAHAVGERLERASGVLLVVFGLAYGLWARRKGGHFHPGGALLHARDEREHCDGHEGPDSVEHLHYHADDAWIGKEAGKGAVALALIVGLNPCVLVLPTMVATASQGAGALALVTLAYSVTTIALMVGLSVAGVVGSRRLPVPSVARHMETASGLLIAIVGAVFLLIDR
jgi:ABC-type nickel/cobalt efflux system permease component RcnA